MYTLSLGSGVDSGPFRENKAIKEPCLNEHGVLQTHTHTYYTHTHIEKWCEIQREGETAFSSVQMKIRLPFEHNSFRVKGRGNIFLPPRMDSGTRPTPTINNSARTDLIRRRTQNAVLRRVLHVKCPTGAFCIFFGCIPRRGTRETEREWEGERQSLNRKSTVKDRRASGSPVPFLRS